MPVKSIFVMACIGICVACAPVLATDVKSRSKIDNLTRDQLTKEFNGAFPVVARPNGVVRKFELRASEFESGIRPPYRATVWGYNKQIPGPVIRVNLGDTLEVKLINNLPQATSIHWHGVRLPNVMDGVPGLTQKAVASGDSFTYRFSPKDAGTFWFHPHFRSAEQVEKGLYGVLIVDKPKEPRYSREFVWILDDWLLQPDGTIYNQFVTRHDLAHDGRWGNFLTINGQYQPTFEVKPGERIRVRIINVANGRVFSPLISGGNPLVIAVDGMLVAEPFPFRNFFLSPGNRVDLDWVIPRKAAGTQWKILDNFSGRAHILGTFRVVSNERVVTPEFAPPKADRFPEWKNTNRVPISHEFILDATRGGAYGISWTIDGKVWPEAEPLELESGRFYRLRFTNLSGRLHPMHLHGQFFRLLSRQGRAANELFWRDTVLVGPDESIDIALVPVDPGLWANHCHILEHAEAGMMSAIRVR